MPALNTKVPASRSSRFESALADPLEDRIGGHRAEFRCLARRQEGGVLARHCSDSLLFMAKAETNAYNGDVISFPVDMSIY